MASISAENSAASPPTSPHDTEVHGLFHKYQSAFWALMAVLVGARYMLEQFLLEPGKNMKNNAIGPKDIAAGEFLLDMYSGGAVVAMAGAPVLFGVQTWRDMHTFFGEALSVECNKPAEKINAFDMMRSKNPIIHGAAVKLAQLTFKRTFIGAAPLLIGVAARKFVKQDRIESWRSALQEGGLLSKVPLYLVTLVDNFHDPENAAKASVGAMGAYLVKDVFSRRETFFERLQRIIDKKIDHADQLGEKVETLDIINLYNTARSQFSKNYTPPPPTSSQWAEQSQLCERMADLLNQTYKNTIAVETPRFTVNTLIYLMGHEFIKPQPVEYKLALVEVANAYGLSAVKGLQEKLDNQMPLEKAMRAYPVIAPERFRSASLAAATEEAGEALQAEQARPSFQSRFAENQPPLGSRPAVSTSMAI